MLRRSVFIFLRIMKVLKICLVFLFLSLVSYGHAPEERSSVRFFDRIDAGRTTTDSFFQNCVFAGCSTCRSRVKLFLEIFLIQRSCALPLLSFIRCAAQLLELWGSRAGQCRFCSFFRGAGAFFSFRC